MITPKDLAALPVMAGVRILAGVDVVARRSVKEVAVLDVEPLTGDYDSFYPGDAVFTSLGFSGGESALVDEALVCLINRDVACIFIKGSIPYEPSERVVAASRRRSVPLIRYDSGLLEQIITDARGMLAADAAASLIEEQLRQLLDARATCEVRRRFMDVTGLAGSRVQAVAFFADEGDPLVLSALRAQLSKSLSKVAPCLVIRFGEGLLALLVADDLDALETGDIEALTAGFGRHCAAGLSEMLAADGADGAIAEALGCGEAAKRTGRSVVSWEMLGPEAFRIARGNGLLLERACAAGLGRLAASDEEAGSNLVESMRVYVECGGETALAAERLCQHPNSVRNRVNRARAVLAMEDATDKQLFAYLSMIFL
ncbi:helix-turn-helix domain-containing protein [Adlercreutzia sp. R25]|uniref:Helix-turn-helix domain-containing protein n=1 Tax=Adlercreutzia shanghongiae TaxID=3111773 RepID=A0ABU6J0W8_9ACTN|nr:MULTISPECIES: helix-turn-helix domain-containing protein [unclassified Adlercreutzia]MEC4273466.1 helix-turn-helix domain-containing protein [Adlercreutzia sp. R25]MEC4295728.1 helix-turn-helix domain-containing protein [Adlercreutzia sp. R22]